MLKGSMILSLQENAEQKLSKCQELFQGCAWTAKWQVSFQKGKGQELHSEKIIQTGLTEGLQQSVGWVWAVPENRAAQYISAHGKGANTLGNFGKHVSHKAENKKETTIKTLTKV